MDRDRRLTGYLRGQTDNPTAPPGFELNHPWRVSRPEKLNRQMLKVVRSRKDSSNIWSILLLLHGGNIWSILLLLHGGNIWSILLQLHGGNGIGVVTKLWVVFIEQSKLGGFNVIMVIQMFPYFTILDYARSILCAIPSHI